MSRDIKAIITELVLTDASKAVKNNELIEWAAIQWSMVMLPPDVDPR